MIASEVGRTTSLSASSSPPPWVTYATCGANPSTCSASLLQKALGNEQREIRVHVPGRLDAAVERLLNQLPDRIAVRPDDHATLDRRVVGELRALDDVQVPTREVFRAGRDFGDEAVRFVVFCHQIQILFEIHAMALPVQVVALGKILSKVRAAAFFAPQRGARDEPRDDDEPAKRCRLPNQNGSTPRAASRRPAASSSPARERNRPTERHIRSRMASLGGRWLGGWWLVVGGGGCARTRSPSARGRCGLLLHRNCGASAKHEPLEQGVACEPIRAVDSGARRLRRPRKAPASMSSPIRRFRHRP